EVNGELNGILELTYSNIRMNELILTENIKKYITRIVHEQRNKSKLSEFGLNPRRKILFMGSPGTGKTMAAVVLSTELKLPLYRVVLDGLITRYMGETAAKLRQIFDHIKK